MFRFIPELLRLTHELIPSILTRKINRDRGIKKNITRIATEVR